MGNINRVVLSGHITREPELRQAGSTVVLEFGLAFNERVKNSQTEEWEDRANFITVLIWGNRGEALFRFLTKGSKVAVEGRLRYSDWVDKDSGKKRSKIELVANNLDLLFKREAEDGESAADTPDQSAASSVEVLTEDIPF